MCGLLLLDTAKAADVEFQTPYHSSSHTTSSAETDVCKMTKYLLEENVTNECDNPRRVNFKFDEPIALGMGKIVKGWLKEYLKSSGVPDVDEETVTNEDVDIDYELSSVTI